MPIVKTLKRYPPVESAQFVETVPYTAEYIGTIKVVPRDYSFEVKDAYNTALRSLQKAAAKAGANYIYVTYSTAPNKDFYSDLFNAFAKDYGEGVTIEAELYR